jgi:hypothetical protein
MMQSYGGFWLIPNYFALFSSKAMDKKPDFGQNEEIASNSVQTMMIYSSLYILKPSLKLPLLNTQFQ